MPVDLRALLLCGDQELGVVDVVLRECYRCPEKGAVVTVDSLAARLLVPAPGPIGDARRPRVPGEPISTARNGEVGVQQRRVDDVSAYTLTVSVTKSMYIQKVMILS